MSGNGDGGSLNAEEELSARKNTSADEENASKNETASTLPKDDGDQNKPLTSKYKADYPLNVSTVIGAVEDDLEAIIEKKLNLEKEKAPDIDSELDFELKWDDENEIGCLNDDESLMENDTMAHSNKNQGQSETIELETIGSSTTANQVDVNPDIHKANVTPLATTNQANLARVGSDDDAVFKVDTSIKIDFANKVDSETNSLDEHLVYSDVEAPEIEDKELLDELDAHISNTDKTDNNMEKTNALVWEVTQEKESDNICQKDLNSAEMDVDDNIIEKLEKPVLNETVSTITGSDSSTYDVNMEHKLANLDVMIDIPTQELIEDLDDTEDFEGAAQYDEDLLLQYDTEVSPVKYIENTSTNEQAKPEKLTTKEIADTISDLEDKLLADADETVDDIQAENPETEAELIPENYSNMIETSKMDEDIEVDDKENHADIILEASHQESEDLIDPTNNIKEMDPSVNIETVESVNVESKLDEEVHKLTSIVDTAADDSILLAEEKELSRLDNVESSTSEVKEFPEHNTNATLSLEATEVTETEVLSPKLGLDVKEVTSKDLPKEVADAKVDDFIDNSQSSTSKSDDSTPKKLESKNVDIAQPLPKVLEEAEVEDFINTQPPISKLEELQLKELETKNVHINTAQPLSKPLPDAKVDDIIDAQPSISKSDDLQPKNLDIGVVQLSKSKADNSQLVVETKNVDIDMAQPSISKADNLQLVAETKNVDIDMAQPSTSKADNLHLESERKNVDVALPSTSKADNLQLVAETKNVDIDIEQPSTSKADNSQLVAETKNVDIDMAQPSTSKADNLQLETETKNTEINTEQPSTSNLMQELSDEDQETDTLGLLAESSRVMDDDDEQEQEQDDDDDDDDFDQDEESNQMTAEHSEDSNAQQSETDVAQETMDVDPTEVDKELPELPEVISDDVEVTEPVIEDSVEVNESEVEMAVNALISTNLEEDSADAAVVSDADVKLSSEGSDSSCKLRALLTNDKDGATEESQVTSPSKVKKLEISKPKHEYNIVELEESSSEDDVQVVNKSEQPESSVTSVNIPSEIEVMAAGGELSKLTERDGEVVISVPKPPPHKPARLNTGEVTIKTVVEPMLIPEATVSMQDPKPKPKPIPKVGLEIFNLDSDDDEKDKESKKPVEDLKCINIYCTSDSTVPRASADAAAAAYYGGARRGAVCTPCALAVQQRTQSLIEGIKDLTPLLSLDMGQIREELVEISDSDSEEEVEVSKKPEDAIGEITAKYLEENLENMFNTTWLKYNMDGRLQEAQKQIDIEVRQFEEDCKEIDTMLSECQVATDKLRRDLYDTFAHERKELPAILIFDTPTNMWSGLEDGITAYEKPEVPTRQSKRRLQASAEPPAKKPAIPLGYTPLDNDTKTPDVKVTATPTADTNIPVQNEDDNADISVVKLSAESAPAGLPPVGTARRPPLRPQMPVYAMRNAFGAWLKAKIVDVQPKLPNAAFTMCRVKFEHKVKNPCKVLPARCLAYDQPSEVRMTIGTRVIALFADTQSTNKSYYSGIIAEIPNPVNNYRYLVFFDDGYAQYVQHAHTRLVCECAPLVWDEVHPFSRQFVRDYLRAYPERPMVRAHAGQSLKTEWNGRWWVSKVIQVDASLVQVHFEEDNRTEWIYRGSTRLAPLYLELQAAERQRARPLPRAAPGRRVNMPYVEYTRTDESAPTPTPTTPAQFEQELRRQRAVAKKSTAPAQPAPPAPLDGVSSRVVFYTPKKTIKPHKMVPHTCGPRCRRTDVLALKDLRTYNPLTKPLLSGWERQIVKYRFTKSVMYRAPCGRRIRDYKELHRYLQSVGSEMGVDLFDFGVHTHCLAEFVLNKCLVSKKDLSHGKENVPVPCVNYYDSSLPEFCSYNTERTPTAGVPLNLDPEFLCGCDCTDDCADKSKCACWKMTLEGARTIGLDTNDVGYVYRRLPEPLPSGIYECNIRCKCRQTCLNRVAQHPLQLKLQVFKTLNRGWGIRALNDVPKGAFLCVYAGNLLTDATANLDGLNEGDEYLAELDYIEVVEQMKEGFEEDIPEEDKKLDQEAEESSSASSSSEEERDQRDDTQDADFRPAERLLRSQVPEYSKRLRKREKAKKKEKENKDKQKEKSKENNGSGDDCITISDDEELREPSRFAAQAGMGGKEFVSKYKSVRAHFGKDEACYIMDAKVKGNIGRYLNHSCTPNVFVQNVFVDTHDPRFPWVAFFALAHIRAGTELTWNYNYDVGSVPGKVLYCHCAAPNCRGRLL